MQSSQPIAGGTPTHAAATTLTTAAAAVPSPFISLSLQCEPLYRIGNQPHPYAFISEQSVYTRATEQLRFYTPSPLYSRLPQAQLQNSHKEDLSNVATVQENQSAMPHVCMTASPPSLFPSIRRIELAWEAEEKQRQSQAPSLWSTPSVISFTDTFKQQHHHHHQQVQSGIDLATAAFQSDYQMNVTSKAHSSQEERGAAQRKLRGEATGAFVDYGVLQDSATTTTIPTTPTSSSITFFPPSVVVRAVAQMVLSMQASKKNSAARFLLAQYRGVSLPAWVHASQKDASLSAKAVDFRLRDALVFSVLPQVVADHMTAGQGHSGSIAEDAAVFYAVKSHTDGLLSLPSCAPPTSGKKHTRAGLAREQGSASITEAQEQIIPGPLCCVRLSGVATSATQLPLTFSAATPDTFQTLHQTSSDTAAGDTAETSLDAADITLYADETTWLTRGVLYRLFTFPVISSTTRSVTVMEGSGGGGSETAAPAKADITEESRRSTYATFLRTSAFLLLSFLVHRTWCLHVHEAVAEALLARLKAQQLPPSTAKGVSFVAVQVTCLPRLAEVQRTTQHEWRSKLTYRLTRPRLSKRDDSASEDSADRGTVPATAALTKTRTWIWQLTVTVINRSAELHWFHCGHPTSSAEEKTSTLMPGGTFTNACAGKPSPATEGSGRLDELVRQIQSS